MFKTKYERECDHYKQLADREYQEKRALIALVVFIIIFLIFISAVYLRAVNALI